MQGLICKGRAAEVFIDLSYKVNRVWRQGSRVNKRSGKIDQVLL